jgi:hypothetical protein
MYRLVLGIFQSEKAKDYWLFGDSWCLFNGRTCGTSYHQWSQTIQLTEMKARRAGEPSSVRQRLDSEIDEIFARREFLVAAHRVCWHVMQSYIQKCSDLALKQMLATVQGYFADLVICKDRSRDACSKSRVRLL